MTHKVFVYGTLRQDLRDLHLQITGRPLWDWVPRGALVGKGTIAGRLHKLTELVPGIKVQGVSEDNRVTGEVLEVSDADLNLFDRLEGHPNSYKRREVPVLLTDGSTQQAWVYEYLHNVGPLVPDGDWKPVFVAGFEGGLR